MIFGSYNRKNLSCKGKSNVLELRKKVGENAEISRANIMYFVDTDFDENITDVNVYSTPCHSVENLYASTKTLENILKDELELCAIKEAPLINSAVKLYERIEALSDEALAELNAFIIAYSSNENIKLNLNDHEAKKFVTLSLNEEEISKLYSFEDLLTIFSIEANLDKSVFLESLETVNGKEKNVFCRGKYRLDCFRQFLNLIFDCARGGTGLFTGNVIRPKITLSKNNILSTLSQYAPTPACLVSFLQNYASRIAA
jgi:hypothetical protein